MRKLYMAERKQIPDEYKALAGKAIFERLTESEKYKNAESIFAYMSMKNEVPTEDIIKTALSEGKTVALPIALPGREMFFVKIYSLENMKKTKLGVMEPAGSRNDELKPGKNTLLVVPGVAFDEAGHRMGYGGGYYDTYIEKYGIENTTALAFDAQVKSAVPCESHDKIMNVIITEKRLIRREGHEQAY